MYTSLFKKSLLQEKYVPLGTQHFFIRCCALSGIAKGMIIFKTNLIKDKIILIMSASSGIGAATTKKLAKEDAKLVIAARREDRLKKIVRELHGLSVDYVTADVRKFEDVEKVVNFAKEKFGKIYVLFNDAGIMPTAPLSDCRRDEWKNMLDINVMGVLNGIDAVLPTMIGQKNGQIIATDSVAGHVVYPNSAVYYGTKYAVRAIIEGLRQEQKENNIRSTIISPCSVDTELYLTINDPKGKEQMLAGQKSYRLQPENVADAIAYAISQPENVTISEVLIRPTLQVR